jgi:hypothetical protein
MSQDLALTRHDPFLSAKQESSAGNKRTRSEATLQEISGNATVSSLGQNIMQVILVFGYAKWQVEEDRDRSPAVLPCHGS